MQNMIQEIVQTDKASRLEVEKAVERRKQLEQEIEDQRESFEVKCREEAQAKIEMAKEQLNSGLKSNTAVIEKETAQKSNELKAIYEAEHEKWEKIIFENVIG